MNDCYFVKKDWRQCKKEVSSYPSNLFLGSRSHLGT